MTPNRFLGEISVRKTFHVVIEKDSEGFYVGTVPGLPGCHSQAKSPEVLRERMKEAIKLYLEVDKTTPVKLDFVGIQQIEVNV